MKHQMIQYIVLSVTVLGVLNTNLYSMNNLPTNDISYLSTGLNPKNLDDITTQSNCTRKEVNSKNIINLTKVRTSKCARSKNKITIDTTENMRSINSKNKTNRQKITNIEILNNKIANNNIIDLRNNPNRNKILKIERWNNLKNVVNNNYLNNNRHLQNDIQVQNVIKINILNNNQKFIKTNNNYDVNNNINEQNIANVNVTSNNKDSFEFENDLCNPFKLDANEYNKMMEIMKLLWDTQFIQKDLLDANFIIINHLRTNLYNIIRTGNLHPNVLQDTIINYIRKNLIVEYIKYVSGFINVLNECNNILCNSVATKIENITLENTKYLRNNVNENEIQVIDNIILALQNMKNSINHESQPSTIKSEENITNEIDTIIKSYKYILYPVILYVTFQNSYMEEIEKGDIIILNNNNEDKPCNNEYLNKLQKYKKQVNGILDKISDVDIIKVFYKCVHKNITNCENILREIKSINNETHNTELSTLDTKITKLLYTQSQLIQNYIDFYTKPIQTHEDIMGQILNVIYKYKESESIHNEELKKLTVSELVAKLNIGDLSIKEICRILVEMQQEKLQSKQW